MSIQAVNSHRISISELVARNIRALAGWQGMTQLELGRRIGLTSGAVSLKWNGKRLWKLEELDAVADALGVEPWELTRPLYDNGGQPKLTAVRESYTAWDSNPEPSD